MKTKKCICCGEEKDIARFYSCGMGGIIYASCSKCRKIYRTKEWRKANKLHVSDYGKKYSKDHSKEKKEYMDEYRKINKIHLLEWYKAYSIKNKDRIRENSSKYKASERGRKADRLRRKKYLMNADNRRRISNAHKKYMNDNKEKHRRLRKHESEVLSDSYIKMLLTARVGLNHKDIPQDMVEYKRDQLMLARKLEET